MKNLLVIFILLVNVPLLISQPGGEYPSILYSSLHVIPGDSLNDIYYTYKLPYNRVVFEKTNGKYSAGFNIAVEIIDSNENFVFRGFDDKKITTNDFEATDSRDNYIDGIIEFKLKTGEFTVIPILTDKNSGREIKLKPEQLIITKKEGSEICRPFIIKNSMDNCGGGDSFILANFEDNFPFSEEEYNLIIPVMNENINSVSVAVINEKDTVFNGLVSDSFVSGISLEACENNIVVRQDKSVPPTKNFIVKDFSNKLKVGNMMIAISKINESKSTETKKPDKIFQQSVKWYNKPYSLGNTEEAIKALKNIEGEEVVKKLLSEKEENYQAVLFDFWKKYDPTPGSVFNPLMNEFYSRVDYAIRNFSTIAGKSGMQSDRGLVFIKFGKPIKIERDSNEMGKVVETWVYENPQRKFIFVDQKGTGDFSLMKG